MVCSTFSRIVHVCEFWFALVNIILRFQSSMMKLKSYKTWLWIFNSNKRNHKRVKNVFWLSFLSKSTSNKKQAHTFVILSGMIFSQREIFFQKCRRRRKKSNKEALWLRQERLKIHFKIIYYIENLTRSSAQFYWIGSARH